jgi:hypothetical protein
LSHCSNRLLRIIHSSTHSPHTYQFISPVFLLPDVPLSPIGFNYSTGICPLTLFLSCIWLLSSFFSLPFHPFVYPFYRHSSLDTFHPLHYFKMLSYQLFSLLPFRGLTSFPTFVRIPFTSLLLIHPTSTHPNDRLSEVLSLYYQQRKITQGLPLSHQWRVCIFSSVTGIG